MSNNPFMSIFPLHNIYNYSNSNIHTSTNYNSIVGSGYVSVISNVSINNPSNTLNTAISNLFRYGILQRNISENFHTRNNHTHHTHNTEQLPFDNQQPIEQPTEHQTTVPLVVSTSLTDDDQITTYNAIEPSTVQEQVIENSSSIENISSIENSSSIESTFNLCASSNIMNTIAYKSIYRNCGWYSKSTLIISYIKGGDVRCYQCYNMVKYNDIEYAKIIFLNTVNINKYKKKITLQTKYNNEQSVLAINNQLYLDPVVCVCTNCCKDNITLNKLPKYAPRSYSDLLSDYILNEQYELITNDITTIYNNNKFNIINDKINYLNFNLNEKQIILNNLVNRNNNLTNNINLEIEKFTLLNKQYLNNTEI